MQHRGPGAIGETPRLAATPLGGDPSRLQAITGGPLAGAGGVQTGSGRIHALRVPRLRLVGSLEAPLRRLQPPARQPGLGPGCPPLFTRQAATQRGQTLGQAPLLQRRLPLAGQLLETGLGLPEAVGQPLHRGAHLLEAPERVVAGDPEGADAGGLLHQGAPLAGGRLDDRLDVVLGDHRIAVLGQPGAAQKPLDVAEPGTFAIDPVLDVASAHDAAADRHLGVVDRQLPVLVVQDQLDLGHTHPVAPLTAGKDHLVEAAAPELPGVGLTQCPADGVDQVALATAVGTDHAGDARLESDLGAVGEGLEPAEDETLQSHPPDSPCRTAPTSTSGAP